MTVNWLHAPCTVAWTRPGSLANIPTSLWFANIAVGNCNSSKVRSFSSIMAARHRRKTEIQIQYDSRQASLRIWPSIAAIKLFLYTLRRGTPYCPSPRGSYKISPFGQNWSGNDIGYTDRLPEVNRYISNAAINKGCQAVSSMCPSFFSVVSSIQCTRWVVN